MLRPYAEVADLFGGRDLRIAVLRPPYPCAGRGTLKVVRVADNGAVSLVVTYDDFVRLT